MCLYYGRQRLVSCTMTMLGHSIDTVGLAEKLSLLSLAAMKVEQEKVEEKQRKARDAFKSKVSRRALCV